MRSRGSIYFIEVKTMFKPLESKGLGKAQRRLKGFRYLHPQFDLGNGINTQDFVRKTETMEARLKAHNELVTDFLAKVTASRAEVKELDQDLAETAERMLNTIAAIYGKDSDEYEMAGGTKRSTAKKKAEKTISSNSATKSNGAVSNSTSA
jgi:hypothetical protein